MRSSPELLNYGTVYWDQTWDIKIKKKEFLVIEMLLSKYSENKECSSESRWRCKEKKDMKKKKSVVTLWFEDGTQITYCS